VARSTTSSETVPQNRLMYSMMSIMFIIIASLAGSRRGLGLLIVTGSILRLFKNSVSIVKYINHFRYNLFADRMCVNSAQYE